MSRTQRLILFISILATCIAFLDGSVVNVALPAIKRDLGGGLQVQQWIVDAYTLTLGSLILLAGSLSDLFGRKRVLTNGLIGFGITSMLCAIAPNSVFLITARALQGIAGALLVPSSLALIMSVFNGRDQGKAIGRWTAWAGIATVLGPLLGGFLVDDVSWRLIFAINIIPIAICLYLMSKVEVKTEQVKRVKIDLFGAVLCSLGLAGTVFGLIEQSRFGWGSPAILVPLLGGLLVLGVFILHEHRSPKAMLPLSLFRIRNFSAGNLATMCIYAALSIASFLIIIFLQQVEGYSAIRAGVTLLPITIIMFLLSPRFGNLSSKYGPRLFMTVGPIVGGIGYLLMLRVTNHIDYWTQLFPGVIVFALGLSITVAPLTAAVLGDIDKSRSGIASAVNNAVSRVAGLIAVALIGIITGPNLNLHGFKHAILITALLVIIGGVISGFGIRNTSNS
jgi:EmrB/QacA subfamily drug resistance transporter